MLVGVVLGVGVGVGVSVGDGVGVKVAFKGGNTPVLVNDTLPLNNGAIP